MNTEDIFKSTDLTHRPMDYIQEAQNTLDSYPNGLAHGVQKDAIQNGWDAIPKKTKKLIKDNWKFEFEILELPGGTVAITMTDFGTRGLTGKMSAKDNYSELPEKERWAKWESMAFTKSEKSSLGARGKGKMIFIRASKDFSIFYDSLREDGSYRFGGTKATHRDCPVFHKDEEEGMQFIREKIKLEPIDHQGSRVIIINPEHELIKSIKKGEFLTFIEETWWPVIQKYGAEITIKYDRKIVKAGMPKLFPITEDTKETRSFKTWPKKNLEVLYDRKPFKIKRLCFACDLESNAPVLHQGISCFRDVMKVETIQFPNKSIREKVFGYVEFEEDANKELRGLELPSHYGFRETGLWKKFKELIEDELDAFGNQKLGLSIDRREIKRMRRNDAENRAMGILKMITRNWQLSKIGPGNDTTSNDDGNERPIKSIAVQLSGLIFPGFGNVPRLNYGDSLKGFVAKIFNRTKNKINLRFTMSIISGDRIVKELDRRNVFLEPHSKKTLGPYNLNATERLFPEPGEYRLILSITDKVTNNRLDRIIRRFWIEMEPKLRGPFDIQGYNFDEFPNPDIKNREWYLNYEGDQKYTLYYNWEHPVYLHNDEDEEKLTRYLSEIFCLGALQLIIKKVQSEEEKNNIEDLPFDYKKIESKNPAEVFNEFSKAISIIKGKIHKLI